MANVMDIEQKHANRIIAVVGHCNPAVMSLSLGVETVGGVMAKLIKRNTPLPARKTEIFSTVKDHQTAVDVKIYQGEREMAANNILLAQFRLDGIPPAARGVPRVMVTFEVDAYGMLNISAKDGMTGKEKMCATRTNLPLNRKLVDRLVREAQQHDVEDRRRRQLVDACNEAAGIIYQVERLLHRWKNYTPVKEELASEEPAIARDWIESQVAEVQKAIQHRDLHRIRTSCEILQQMACVLCHQKCIRQTSNADQAWLQA